MIEAFRTAALLVFIFAIPEYIAWKNRPQPRTYVKKARYWKNVKANRKAPLKINYWNA